jgi:hypothetical protein
MKRTLLAIGLAVLVSMMVAPHRLHHEVAYLPFFMDSMPWYQSEHRNVEYRSRRANPAEILELPKCSEEGQSWDRSPDGCVEGVPPYVKYHEIVDVPGHWMMVDNGPVAIDRLALQTVFLATLFVVLANIRWRRKV